MKRITALVLVSLIFILCFLLASDLVDAKSPKGQRQKSSVTALHDVALLLPALPGKEKLSYVLRATNGCYKWSSTRTSVATVKPLHELPEDPSCSRSAVVTAVGPPGSRSKAFIMAHELSTLRVLRCEVFVDAISSIEITHTSTSIYVHERETLNILAYDSNNPPNLFSTVAGLPFTWTVSAPISSSSESASSSPSSNSAGILRLLPRSGSGSGSSSSQVSVSSPSSAPAAGIGSTSESHLHPDFSSDLSEISSNAASTTTTANLKSQSIMAESVLVQGLSTGNVVVTARLESAGSVKDVAPASLKLSVFEPLSLHPHEEIYIVPSSTVQYELHTRKSTSTSAAGSGTTANTGIGVNSNSEIQVVSLPSSRFIFSSTNETVATVSGSALVSSKELGFTEIALMDGNMPENIVHAAVHVVNVNYLSLGFKSAGISLSQDVRNDGGDVMNDLVFDADDHDSSDSPSTIVHLTVDKEYNMIVTAYDEGGNHIRPTKNLRFDLASNPEYFVTVGLNDNDNGDTNTFRFKALKTGSTTINATLVTSHEDEGQEPVSVTARIVIVPPVILTPNTVLLPNPAATTAGSVEKALQIKASGGDGMEYQWTSFNTSVVSVGPTGDVMPRNLGVSTITAASRQDLSNRDSATITVDDLAALKFIPSIVEVEIDGTLILGVNATNDKDRSFYPGSCSALDLTWHVDDASAFSISGSVSVTESEAEAEYAVCRCACACVKLRALRPSTTDLRVRFKTLEATVTIASFSPLRIDSLNRLNQGKQQKQRNEILVTLGASVVFNVEGGPAPWVFDQASHGVNVFAAAQAPAQVVVLSRLPNPKSKSKVRYRAECVQLGEETIVAEVGNRPTTRNKYPVVSTARISFACRVPQAVIVTPIEGEYALVVDGDGEDGKSTCHPGTITTMTSNDNDKHSDGTSVSAVVQGSRYFARNDKPLLLRAVILDVDGHVFANASTTPLRWSSDDSELVSFSQSAVEGVEGGEGAKYASTYLVFGASKSTSVQITANLTNEDDSSWSCGGSISLNVVDPVTLLPQSTSLYNSPHHSLLMRPVGGSGQFKFSVNNTEVGRLISDTEGRVRDGMRLLPLRAGSIRVTVSDMCFDESPRRDSHSDVLISGVSQVHVRARTLLEVGHDMNVEVRALASNGSPFPAEQFGVMRLGLETDSGVFELEGSGLQYSIGADFATQAIRGLNVGSSILVASCCASDGDDSTCTKCTSQPLQISVHPPLQILPRSLVLLPGSVFQVEVTGGPSSGVQVVYEIEAGNDVVTVDGSGVVRANPNTNTRTQDTGVGVKATLHAFVLGHDILTLRQAEFGRDSIEISVVELDSIAIQTPSTHILVGEEVRVRVEGLNGQDAFALGSGEVEIEWKAADDEILGVDYKDNSVSIALVGKSAGITSVTARVVSTKSTSNVGIGLIDTVTFTVSDRLEMIGSDIVMLPPHSQARILTTGDKLRKLSYDTLYGSSSSGDQETGVTVSAANGHVTAGNSCGTVVVRVSDADPRRHHPSHSTLCRVVVKNVAQLHLKPLSHSIPVGSTASIKVVPKDDMGAPFASHDSIVFRVESNHRDVVSPSRAAVLGTASNATFIGIRALQQGEAVIRVSLRDAPHVSDYVVIQVTSSITPALPILHIGANVTFRYSVNSLSGAGAGGESSSSHSEIVWSSSDESVLTINSGGFAKAVGVGEARVTHATHGTQAFTDVRVVPVSRIRIATPLPTFITNANSRSYVLPLIFDGDSRGVGSEGEGEGESESEKQPLLNKGGVKQNIVVGCKVVESLWAHAHPSSSSSSSLSSDSCIINPSSAQSTSSHTHTHTPPPSITFIISATDVTSSYRMEKSVSIPFKPAFKILNPRDAMWLSAADTAAVIQVQDVLPDEMLVTPSFNTENSRRISIQHVSSSTPHSHSHSVSLYEIRVVDSSASFNTSVLFKCFVTDQQVVVPVSYTRAARVPVQRDHEEGVSNVKGMKSSGGRGEGESVGDGVESVIEIDLRRPVILGVLFTCLMIAMCLVVRRRRSFPVPISSPSPVPLQGQVRSQLASGSPLMQSQSRTSRSNIDINNNSAVLNDSRSSTISGTGTPGMQRQQVQRRGFGSSNANSVLGGGGGVGGFGSPAFRSPALTRSRRRRLGAEDNYF